MLDNEDYRHTLRICNTYCFSTATTFTGTLLKVRFIRALPVLYTYATQLEGIFLYVTCFVFSDLNRSHRLLSNACEAVELVNKWSLHNWILVSSRA
jgi:hypothetical protein